MPLKADVGQALIMNWDLGVHALVTFGASTWGVDEGTKHARHPLAWPRRDHRRFLLPRPRIQDEPRDFACRIPDESDPGVIFVVYGEFVA
jgi:hypothetical protein